MSEAAQRHRRPRARSCPTIGTKNIASAARESRRASRVPVSPLRRSSRTRESIQADVRQQRKRRRARTSVDDSNGGLKLWATRFRRYQRREIRDILNKTVIGKRSGEDRSSDRCTPPTSPTISIRVRDTEPSTPPRRRMSRNRAPITSPLTVRRSRSTPTASETARQADMFFYRYRALSKCVIEICESCKRVRDMGPLLRQARRRLEETAAAATPGPDRSRTRSSNVRYDLMLEEMMCCPGSWDELSDDEDHEGERIKQNVNTQLTVPSKITSWLDSLWRGGESVSSSHEPDQVECEDDQLSRIKKLRRDSRAYYDLIWNAIKSRKMALSSATRRSRDAQKRWRTCRARVSNWSLPDNARRCFEERWILVEQRLALTAQLASSAIEILSRRLQIAKLMSDAHEEMLKDATSLAGTKIQFLELEDEERSMMTFVKVSPHMLMRRDEQREAIKTFVRSIDGRIKCKTASLNAMRRRLEPLSEAQRRLAIQSTVDDLRDVNARWCQRLKASSEAVDASMATQSRVDVCTAVSSNVRNAVDGFQELIKDLRRLQKRYANVVMDTRTQRGICVRRCCDAIVRLQRTIADDGMNADMDMSKSIFRLGSFVAKHFADLLAQEMWLSVSNDVDGHDCVDSDQRRTCATLLKLSQAMVFRRLPRMFCSNQDDVDREGLAYKMSWMRTLPMDHFGFHFASNESLPLMRRVQMSRRRRRRSSHEQSHGHATSSDDGVLSQSPRALNGELEDRIEYDPFFPCATKALNTLCDVPLCPSMIAENLVRVIQILFLEIKAMFGAVSSETSDTAAEVLLPSLICTAAHTDRMSQLRGALLFSDFWIDENERCTSTCRERANSEVWLRRAESRYYVTSALAALSWIEEQVVPSATSRNESKNCDDYEALLDAFNGAIDISGL